MFCGMVTIGGARGLHDRRSGRSVVGSRLLCEEWIFRVGAEGGGHDVAGGVAGKVIGF